MKIKFMEDKITKRKSVRRQILSPCNVYELVLKRLEELITINKEKEESLLNAPPGKIHIIKRDSRVQYYLRTASSDKSGTYISKKDEASIGKYLQKSYDEKVQKLVQKEIKNIEAFLDKSNDYFYEIREVYSNNPEEIKTKIRPVDCSDEDYIYYWMNKPFMGNSMPIQSTEYKTDKGELVRSKSELNIANMLARAGIPYKYECPLALKDGKVVYPDFTILDVKNRRQLYWEHRGMMDDREYVKNTVNKLKIYNRNGIIVGINLIITEETCINPLGTDEINEIIAGIGKH